MASSTVKQQKTTVDEILPAVVDNELNLSLSPAEPKDVHFFVALNELSYRELIETQFGAWDARFQAEECLKKWPTTDFQKVFLDEQLVGGIWVQDARDFHKLQEIQILPEFRNKGIGSWLLNREIERARAANKPLRLSVLLKNPAIRLYRRLGFRIIATDDVRHYMELT